MRAETRHARGVCEFVQALLELIERIATSPQVIQDLPSRSQSIGLLYVAGSLRQGADDTLYDLLQRSIRQAVQPA